KAGTVRPTAMPPEEAEAMDNLLAQAPDGSWLATVHRGDAIRLRDPRTGEERKRLSLSEDGTIVCSCVESSPDGKWLLCGWTDGRVQLWDVATGKEAFHLTGHVRQVNAAEFGEDLRTALSSSFDRTALLWDLRPTAPPDGKPVDLWDELAS